MQFPCQSGLKFIHWFIHNSNSTARLQCELQITFVFVLRILLYPVFGESDSYLTGLGTMRKSDSLSLNFFDVAPETGFRSRLSLTEHSTIRLRTSKRSAVSSVHCWIPATSFTLQWKERTVFIVVFKTVSKRSVVRPGLAYFEVA